MSTLTEYLGKVCGVDTSLLPEIGGIQIIAKNACDLDEEPIIITPDDQFEQATITHTASYVDIKSQASAMAKYRRISGQEGKISLSLHNPYEEKFAKLFMQGAAIDVGAPTTPSEFRPWENKKRVEFKANTGKLPTPYLVEVKFVIGDSNAFAPLTLYAPLAFPTFDEIAIARSVENQSGANVMLECKRDPETSTYMVITYD